MGWEREYEHWRDMGHTWGPGVDDTEAYTDEELAEIERSHQAYLQSWNPIMFRHGRNT